MALINRAIFCYDIVTLSTCLILPEEEADLKNPL